MTATTRANLLMALVLGAFLVVVNLMGAGCGGEADATATAENAITKVCYTSIGGMTGVLPTSATFPLNSQHVYCEFQPDAFTSANWAPYTVPCDGDPPGLFQLDVFTLTWDWSHHLPQDYKCARVNVPAGFPYPYHINFTDMLERGWLASYPSDPYTRYIYALDLGPGVQAIVSKVRDFAATGCNVGSDCQGRVNHQGSPDLWVPTIFTATSMAAQRGL